MLGIIKRKIVMKKVMIKCVLILCFCMGLYFLVLVNLNLFVVEIVEVKFEKKISFEVKSVWGKVIVFLLDWNDVRFYV